MLPYIYLAGLEHREWERRFNARAARGDFVRYSEEESPSVVQALRRALAKLPRRLSLSASAFSRWIAVVTQ